MTAAEILRSAQPPSDDGLIEKAIAELESKLFEWTDALKNANSQLRSAFAVKPAARPSSVLYEGIASLPAAAAAAHMPTPPPPPEWMTSPAAEEPPAWNAAPEPPAPPAWSPPAAPSTPAAAGWAPAQPAGAPAWSPSPSALGSGASSGSEWPQPQQPSQFGGHGISGGPQQQQPGSMAWPTAPGGSWPEQPASPTGALQWPTWNPTDTSGGSEAPKKSSVRASRAPKAVRPALTEGPSPEERAQKAAAEEQLLSGLEDAIARRVRLLRRLDPDTAIEKLIEKARQGHAEAMAAQPPQSRQPPGDKSSSWWRRK